MAIRVGQINAHRPAAAVTNLELIAREKGLDILCLQEPFCYKGKVTGCNFQTWQKSDLKTVRIRVAAVVNQERVEILLNVGNKNEHVMCFRVISGDLEFIVVNVYCQYSVPLERFLIRIERLINCFPTEKLLLTLDANAKSVL